ncbi:acyl-CoA/acyl-ACP dehydrogenase [Entomomonas asaccharolytica]|uniref:Acyl-CoA/acyl-ACP dehydrogenase n=1 Tax=Entomomonas asaccharolytica TaxID=2785331 RepID=A0A974NFA3_9GAMM|nr:acyl-CoA/acyl-ACP dehydrogenase [Entomomonas asaccharolytica]QQP85478.1 acyl-CoA/acyl-ACP dehydrogenase [Entomomonas asaccharolytica]
MKFSSEETIKGLNTIIEKHKNSAPLEILKYIVINKLDDIPLPASGNTLERWQVLAHMATTDLSLAKFYESHCDAKAILNELNAMNFNTDSLWGVWCAEPPHYKVEISQTTECAANKQVSITGTKAWCSGAVGLTHALVSVLFEEQKYLVAVALDDPSISIDTSNWQAVGMKNTNSYNVTFNDTKATIVGNANEYLNRVGFIYGAAGVASCWYGALCKVAHYVKNNTNKKANPYKLAHLGAIDSLLAANLSLIRDTAIAIDMQPEGNHLQQISRMRLSVESAAEEILCRASRALGAVPFCLDNDFAQLMADIPVFIRQSHAEFDQANLAELVLARGNEQWQL